MELHFTPSGEHFTNAINGAVSEACKAIFDKFDSEGLKRIYPLSHRWKIPVIFTDCVGNFREEFITELCWQKEFDDITVIGESGWNGTFNLNGGDDYFIIEPVIGKIYEMVEDVCRQGKFVDGERE